MGARFGINLITAVSREGELRFMVPGGRMNVGRFIQFLKRMLAGLSAGSSGSSMAPCQNAQRIPDSVADRLKRSNCPSFAVFTGAESG